jgi:hypothetical protein
VFDVFVLLFTPTLDLYYKPKIVKIKYNNKLRSVHMFNSETPNLVVFYNKAFNAVGLSAISSICSGLSKAARRRANCCSLGFL